MTKTFSLPLLCITLLPFGCSRTDNESNTESADSSANEKVYTAATLDEYKSMYSLQRYLTTHSDTSKTETVDFDCAILIYPNDEQIAEMKNTIGEEDFYTVADDNNWYQSQAIDLIDSLHITKVTAKDTYLNLKGINKSWTLNLRKDSLPSWNLIFFKRNKEPRIIPSAGLTLDAVKEYFERVE